MYVFSQNRLTIVLLVCIVSIFQQISFSQNGKFYTRVSSQVNARAYVPDDISNLWFWIDADDTTTIFTDLGTTLAKDGDEVRQWNDKSGNNYHVIQNTFANRGIYSYNQFNGRRVVDFDNDDRMEHILGSNYSGDFTLYIILKSQDPSPPDYEAFFASHNNPGTNGSFQINYRTAANGFQVTANDGGTQINYQFAGFVPNQIKLFTVEHDDAANTVNTFDNGNLITAGTGQNDLFFSRFRINSNRNTNRFHDSQIAEVIIYDKLLSNCEKYKIISYLNNKYTTAFTYTPTAGGIDCANNQIWLRADSGTSSTVNGTSINQWDDVSLSGVSFTQPTGANQPIYRNNINDNINFNPVLEFNNRDKSISANSILGNSNSELTGFIVSKEINRVNNFQVNFRNSTVLAERYTLRNPRADGNVVWEIQGNGTERVLALAPFTAGTPYLTTFNNSLSNNKQEIYIDGTILVSDATGANATGLDNTILGTQYDGYIAEFIAYETDLSTIDREIVESYLAIKYGLTLGHDYYREDTTKVFDVTTYGNGIIGLGREDGTALNQTKSKSEADNTSGITIELTTQIGNGVYLVIGHDGGVLTRVSLAGETNVLTRKWYADMTGGVGTINMELDLAALGAGTTPAPSDVKILIANNAAFNNTQVIEATSVVGGVAYFTGIPLYDKYFTFSIP